MRVTESMMFQLAMRDGGKARDQLQTATAEVSSGQRVVQPGDDPAAAGQLALERATADRLTTIGKVAQRASDELSTADSALGDVANDLSRVRELAVQLSSSGYSASERASGAQEVRGLLASIVGSLNSQVGGRYVFGGRLDGAPPFDAAGSYTGDAGVRQVEVAPGVLQDASVRADVALKGVGGGTDVLATLSSLAAALDANDAAAVNATLDGLAAGTQQVAAARAQAGTSMATLDAATAASKAGADAATSRASSLGDADPVQAASQLAQAQQALQAALTATSSSFQLTLLGKLG